MTGIARLARLVGTLVTVGVLGWSTVYFVVYIGRWEWNRAIVSGMVAIGLLVVLSTSLVLRRLSALDRRLDLELAPRADDVICTSNAAAARRRFDWLHSDGEDTGVFIPVLLGTGVILSLLAYTLERVAGAFASTTLDRRTASIIPLDLPLSSGPVAGGPLSATDRSCLPDRSASRRARVLVGLMMAALLGAGVEGVRRLTQSTDGAIHEPGRTTVVIDVDTKRGRTPEAAVMSMWALCRPRVDEPDLVSLVSDGSRVTIEIDRALRPTAERRLKGCFEDAVLDYAVLDVVDVVPVIPVVAEEAHPA